MVVKEKRKSRRKRRKSKRRIQQETNKGKRGPSFKHLWWASKAELHQKSVLNNCNTPLTLSPRWWWGGGGHMTMSNINKTD